MRHPRGGACVTRNVSLGHLAREVRMGKSRERGREIEACPRGQYHSRRRPFRSRLLSHAPSILSHFCGRRVGPRNNLLRTPPLSLSAARLLARRLGRGRPPVGLALGIERSIADDLADGLLERALGTISAPLERGLGGLGCHGSPKSVDHGYEWQRRAARGVPARPWPQPIAAAAIFSRNPPKNLQNANWILYIAGYQSWVPPQRGRRWPITNISTASCC